MKAINFKLPVISLDNAGSYISPIDDEGNDVDVADFFEANDFIYVDGITYPLAEVDGYNVYSDCEYMYKDELFHNILSGDDITEKETNIFIQLHDGISGRTMCIYFEIDLNDYEILSDINI